MREYLFRGKRTDTKEWIYGSLLQWPDGDSYICAPQIENEMSKVQVIPETVGQYTNRLDIDINRVFEGDIVKGENGKIWEVIFSIKANSWMLSNSRIKDNGLNKFAGEEEYSFAKYREICLIAGADTFKKVGNIHDNPELLTTTTNT